MYRTLVALLACLPLTAFCADPPQTAPPQEPETQANAEVELTPQQKADAKLNFAALQSAHERIEAVFGAKRFPNMEASIVTPPPEAAEDEVARHNCIFFWKAEERVDESGTKQTFAIVTIGVQRLRDRTQFAYDSAHIVMDLESPKLPEELIVREPVAMIAAVGGARVEQWAEALEKNGGPLSLEVLEEHLKARKDAPKPATDEERIAARKKLELIQASFYLIGFDLHREGTIKRFYNKEIDCEAFKQALDPAKAWERQKAVLLPPPAPPRRVPLDIRAVG